MAHQTVAVTRSAAPCCLPTPTRRAARAVEQERARVLALVRRHAAILNDYDGQLGCRGCDFVESDDVDHGDHLADLVAP